MKSNINGIILSDYKQDNALVFVDMSFYNAQVSILKPTLSITKPYFTFPIEILYNPKGNTSISTIDLGLSKTQDQIPCGLYKITQSICPAEKMFNTFFYVHLGSVKRTVANLRCQNKIAEAILLDDKIRTLEALTYCKDEKKILTILKTIDCIQSDCQPIINVQPLMDVTKPCKTF